MEDTVKVTFEMPRSEFAKFKYLCIKRNVAIKELLSKAASGIIDEFLDEEYGKTEDRSHEFPTFKQT